MKLGVRVTLAILVAAPIRALGPQSDVEYLPFDQVKNLIGQMVTAGAPDVPSEGIKDAATWDRWIRTRDREIRSRIDQGVEDSISNLILFGTSFTALPPLTGFAQGEHAGQLTQAARARVHALALAIQQRVQNQRVELARDFLVRHRVPTQTLEPYLAGNLKRMIAEEASYLRDQEMAVKTADPETVLMDRATIFKQRGLSFDTSLEADFALDVMLEQLLQKGLMSRGSVRRVAVIGPGLDFADKRVGLDFYPIQTTQPFAVLESVARRGFGKIENLQVLALDQNPYVLDHIQRLAGQGEAGRPYVVELPNDPRNAWDAALVSYWQHFGELLGTPAQASHPPGYLRAIQMRAVAIRPQVASRVAARNLDIVTQQLTVTSGEGFDLVVATNVFLYYNFFEQALAMQNIARMMNPGGVLLVNQVLSNQHPDSLRLVDQTYVSFSSKEQYGDNVVAYQQQ